VCRWAAAFAFAFAFAHGGQAVVPAAAALHGANNHENCSCGLENDVPPPSGTKSRHPPPTQAAQRPHMELLKAFKSPSSVSTGKKNLLSTYSKILFRFNFLRLP